MKKQVQLQKSAGSKDYAHEFKVEKCKGRILSEKTKTKTNTKKGRKKNFNKTFCC